MKEQNRILVDSLRPHFVFNVMNMIRYWVKKDSEKASRMIYDLSVYMRAKMEQVTTSEEIPVEEELNYVGAYLRLEQELVSNLSFQGGSCTGRTKTSVLPGTFLMPVEKLIAEEVRSAKEPCTVCFRSAKKDILEIGVKEKDIWIQL